MKDCNKVSNLIARKDRVSVRLNNDGNVTAESQFRLKPRLNNSKGFVSRSIN